MSWDQGMSRKHVLDAIDASLRRLGTGYVDGYQLHRYDPLTPFEAAINGPIAGANRPVADSLAAAKRGPLPVDLKGRLDEITQDSRRVDADRSRAGSRRGRVMVLEQLRMFVAAAERQHVTQGEGAERKPQAPCQSRHRRIENDRQAPTSAASSTVCEA